MKLTRNLAAAAYGVAAAAALGTLLSACGDFLKRDPVGVIGGEQLNTPTNVDGMVVSAYAALGNDHWITPYTSMWPYGDVRSGDAYKGGGGTGDLNDYNNLEQFVFTTPTTGVLDQMWFRLYVGVGRANDALRRLNEMTEAEYPARTTRQAEVRFIRGHFYFLLKTMYNRVPWIDETLPVTDYERTSNVALTNDALWQKIADDFQFAAANLPATQAQEGRVTKYAALAYLAKVQLYRAYVQNDQHTVTSVDQSKLQQVVQLADSVIGSGKYGLTADFAENFLWETEKNREAVFKINMSLADGTPNGRVDMGNGLNYSMAPGYGCCWFHIPSQNLINAFRTDAAGLPQFTTFNQMSLVDSADYWTSSVDPRVDHTVGIVSHPFKYDATFVFQPTWARTPQVYGTHSSMKELQHPKCSCLMAVGPFWASSKDIEAIRYADVLLWKAEALIELGRQNDALPIVNEVRARAASSTARLKYANGTPVSNYNVKPYTAASWTQEYARQALRWERRLEFAMEGSRFFDLVRWGVAAQTLNDYFAVEKTRHDYLRNAQFTAGRDEYLPIPQPQISFTQGLYQQNPGY
ncbi:MAG TPA: RagB/SusD family nutrient uptake outer membrane protein [Gemmatimonadaceae bacterium]|nr:RagB/SusD family nutrient uptake outer membrane protein [Gemmatimonadaceae bacterium]